MTEPTQSGQYAGHSAPPPQPPAPAQGWPAPPPQQGAPYPYAGAPLGGPGRPPGPPGPPRDPATVSDRLSGALLVVGAVLAIGSSFLTLDSSVAYADAESEEEIFKSMAKAWSYTNEPSGQEVIETTQFNGVLLLIGGLVAIVAAVLLLTGRRLPLTRGFGVAGGALLFGTTLSVVTAAFNDTQWDDDTRTTTFGPGFYVVTIACLLALATTVITLVGTRGPATAVPWPAQSPQAPQPWPMPPTSPQFPPPQAPPAQPQAPPAG